VRVKLVITVAAPAVHIVKAFVRRYQERVPSAVYTPMLKPGIAFPVQNPRSFKGILLDLDSLV
jgi:hypothetical protein